MFERLTDSARRTVVLAQEASRALRHQHIGPEHLLLGLLAANQQEPAGRVLSAAGLTYQSVAAQLTKGPRRQQQGHIPFTAAAKQVLERTVAESMDLGHDFIAPEHILLALLATPDEVLERALDHCETTAADLRTRVLLAGPAGGATVAEGATSGAGGDRMFTGAVGAVGATGATGATEVPVPPWADAILSRLAELSDKIDEIARRLDGSAGRRTAGE